MTFKLNAARRLMADWWSELDRQGQENYIDEHPASKKAKDAIDRARKVSPEEKPAPIKNKALAPGKPLSDYAKSKDDPKVTVADIYSKFSDEDVQEMEDLIAEATKLESSDREYTRNGDYTPERLALHDKILSEFLSPEKIKAATPEKGKKPTFVVLGGRGGSGKSGFTDGKIKEFDSSKFLTLDADAIKQLLDPPYEGWNAHQVHEESSFLFDKLTDMAQKMGLNIISDATLKSDKMGPILEAIQKQGYDIEGHYMFLPRQKAAARACGRYLKGGKHERGRLVPPGVILGNTSNEENFDKLKHLFSRWSAYDNDQPKGTPPKLIDHSDLNKKDTATDNEKVEGRSMSGLDKVLAPVKNSGGGAGSTGKGKGSGSGDAVDNRGGGNKDRGDKGVDADMWENDPYLINNPKRTRKVAAESMNTMRKLKIKPTQIQCPVERKAYVEYLKNIKKN